MVFLKYIFRKDELHKTVMITSHMRQLQKDCFPPSSFEINTKYININVSRNSVLSTCGNHILKMYFLFYLLFFETCHYFMSYGKYYYTM